MAQEIVRPKENNPIVGGIQAASISKASGFNDIAKTLSTIAERSFEKATDYASEASKANLLQTHGMLQDVELNSKLEILKNPGQSEQIAKNAENAIAQIKSQAKLNRSDRMNLSEMAGSMTRSLQLSAAEKSISLARESAKDRYLTSIGDTLQSLRRDIHINPEQADKLIEAQYESLHGQVNSGILTAVEAANIHKQFAAELQMAHELTEGIKSGTLSASDINTYHATGTSQVPMSNAGLPIDQVTAMNSSHYFGQLTLQDIESRFANGERVTPMDLVAIKGEHLDKVLNYGMGAARATGDINSGKSWIELKSKLANLKKQQKLSSQDEGYKNRLNNFINNAEQPGHYQDFIAGMPEGARAYDAFKQRETTIDAGNYFGDESQVARQKQNLHDANLNALISKSNAIGIGMHYPDHLRQPIPLFALQPIMSGFEKGGDTIQAIKSIQKLDSNNRVYAMNAFPGNYRKQLAVYEIGNLTGKADSGFLTSYLESQQVDALGEKKGVRKDSQDIFLQLQKDKTGFSDEKLKARLNPALTNINTYLSQQPDGQKVISSKMDGALRYIKYEAAKHNDYTFEHLNDYIQTFQSNMEAAYGVQTGHDFVMNKNDVPIDTDEMSLLANHGINKAYKALSGYRTRAQINTQFNLSPPKMVSSPGGRIEVVDSEGNVIVDENGHPAFSEIFTNSILDEAKHDLETKHKGVHGQSRFPVPGSINKGWFFTPEDEK